MYKSNVLTFLIFSVFIPSFFCELKFNNLNEKLVMNFIKVNPRTNVVVSEILVRLPLCKLASVAQGKAKEELMTVLGYKDNASLITCFPMLKESINSMKRSDLTLANRIFVNYTSDIDPKFMKYSIENFGIKVDQVGFNYPQAAISHINNWISSMTYRRITTIVDKADINKQTQMIIVTAAHFKGTWEMPFDLRLTKLTQFQRMEGKFIRIPMMSKTDQFQHVETKDCQAVSIRFGSGGSLLTIILPNSPKELPALLDKIYNQKAYVLSLTKNMTGRPMKVTFPRLKIKTFVDWTKFVKKLGLKSIFNTTSSGLEGILKNSKKSIALNKIKQKVFVQIDEVGVARFIRLGYREPPHEQVPNFVNLPKFTADRPFYFDISLNFVNARYEMFTGVYYGPVQTPVVNEVHF